MPRIPDEQIQRLKKEVSLVRLCERYNIDLKPVVFKNKSTPNKSKIHHNFGQNHNKFHPGDAKHITEMSFAPRRMR